MSVAPGTSTTSKSSNAASLSTSDMGTKQRERGLSKVSTKEVSKTSKGHQGSKQNLKRLESGGDSLQASRKCAKQEVKKERYEKVRNDG